MDKDAISYGIKDPLLGFDYVFRNIDKYLSKNFFGNSAGVSNNFKGYLAQAKTKKLSFENKNPTAHKLASKFKQQGNLQLGNFYDSSLINTISKKFNKLIDNDEFSFVRAKREKQVFSRALFRGFELIPESLQLLSKDMCEILELYYGSYFQISKFSFWRNYHVPSTILNSVEVINNRWHCDPYNTSWVKLFVYLTDVTDDDGPFHVQTKERTKELMHLGYKNRINYNLPLDVIEDKDHIWAATGNVGTTFMCNCNIGLHKAGIPKSGHYRDVIQIQLAPSNEKLPQNWFETFMDNEEPVHDSLRNGSNIRPVD